MNPDPTRYLSTNIDKNTGVRFWRVIGFGALPEIRDTEEMEEAVVAYWPPHRAPDRATIPVWDGDAPVTGRTYTGAFTTLGIWESDSPSRAVSQGVTHVSNTRREPK